MPVCRVPVTSRSPKLLLACVLVSACKDECPGTRGAPHPTWHTTHRAGVDLGVAFRLIGVTTGNLTNYFIPFALLLGARLPARPCSPAPLQSYTLNPSPRTRLWLAGALFPSLPRPPFSRGASSIDLAPLSHSRQERLSDTDRPALHSSTPKRAHLTTVSLRRPTLWHAVLARDRHGGHDGFALSGGMGRHRHRP